MKHSEEEFLQAYDEFVDAIFRHCYFRVFDREIASDLTQETFVKTWEYLESGKQVLKLRPFLYRVATNLIIDHSRRKKTLSLEDLRENQQFDVMMDNRENVQDVIDVGILLTELKKLDEKYREVIILRYVEGFNPQEIAEATGETANNISVRLNRGLQKLRAIVAEKKLHGN